MGKCNDCKWWAFRKLPPSDDVDAGMFPCKQPDIDAYDEKHGRMNRYVMQSDGYEPIFTSADFGCIFFEPKRN
jgi:hypothetical protein